MNRTIKEATVRRYHYDSNQQLKTFLAAYNYARRVKTLRGLTPYEYICKCWTKDTGSVQAEPAPSHSRTKHLVLLAAFAVSLILEF